MPAAPEVADRDSLKAWLDSLSRATPEQEAEARRIAVAIAHRAAMRIMPLAAPLFFSKEARKRARTAQPMFRLLIISGVAGVCPTPKMRDAADAVPAAVFTYATRDADAARASWAARAAYSAAAACNAAAAYDYAAATAEAAYTAAADAGVWAAVERDCHAINVEMPLHHTPLWPDGTNPLAEVWRSAAKALTEAGPEWAFWIDWYEKCLKGTPQDWQGILTDIALIPPDDWDKGPKHIAGLIRGVAEEAAHLQGSSRGADRRDRPRGGGGEPSAAAVTTGRPSGDPRQGDGEEHPRDGGAREAGRVTADRGRVA
ncbi:MAG: hypothetical protein ACXIUV_07710 [Alkalilacustris sp.]